VLSLLILRTGLFHWCDPDEQPPDKPD